MEVGEGLRLVARALERIAEELMGLREKFPEAEALRTDHPLQGETLGGIEEALHRIAEVMEERK